LQNNKTNNDRSHRCINWLHNDWPALFLY